MQTIPRTRVDWRAVALFFALACLWSWPLFWLRDLRPEAWAAWRLPMPLRMTVLMWGPGLAALLCLRLFRASHPRTVFPAGGSWRRALAFYFAPMGALAIVGVRLPGAGGGTVHALVLAIAVVGLLNTLGEELGWRGFLQDALRPLPRPARYATIGLLWAAWHFTNLFAHREGSELWTYLAWYLPATIALSALIGEATDRSRAVLVAATLHAWIDLSMEVPGMGTLVVLAGAVPFWAWLLWTWPKPEVGSGRGVSPDALSAAS
jgi:membrane protease YdiL (CAAX protease family)